MSDHQQISPLRRADLKSSPFDQFSLWFEAASKTGTAQPNAMTLATATPDGIPSARIVLLRYFDSSGYTFFTNYQSQKGQELMQNPHAALVFYWEPQGRQVRVSGKVEKIAPSESDRYFDTRPLESRIGAIISNQSQVIPNRDVLERELSRLTQQARTEKMIRPDSWGGYRLVPILFEFWQHRDHRLHDRFRYTKQIDGSWRIERLSP